MCAHGGLGGVGVAPVEFDDGHDVAPFTFLPPPQGEGDRVSGGGGVARVKNTPPGLLRSPAPSGRGPRFSSVYHTRANLYRKSFLCGQISVTGTQLRKIIKHVLRTGALLGVTEFYQFSSGFHIVFDYDAQELLEISLDGKDIEDERIYNVGISSFHFKNLKEFLGVSEEEVFKNKAPKIVATKSADVLEEYFSHKELVKVPQENRLVIKQAAAKRSV